MESEKRSLNIHLGELRKPWDDHCNALGKKPGTAIRELVRDYLNSAIKVAPVDGGDHVEGEADLSQKTRKELRLTESELTAIEKLSSAEGITVQRWIINMLRANLTNNPQFNAKETEVIWESCYQLRAIGRNINQIAKQLNEGKSRDVGLKKLEYLTELINSHTELVNSLVTANINRWVIRVPK